MYPIEIITGLEERLARLELQTNVCLRLLQVLVERLHVIDGKELEPPLAKVFSAEGEVERKEIVARIEELIAAKQDGVAARVVRELAGVIWDEAHEIVAKWHNYSTENKVQWLKVAQLRKAFAELDMEGISSCEKPVS